MDPVEPPAPQKPSRPIRSFVLRQGRLTDAQRRALEELWPRYGVEYSLEMLDLERIFGRSAPRTVEIGFGNGDNLTALASAHPERDYLGIEVHRPGVGRALLAADKLGLRNLRVICRDAVEVFEYQLAPDSLDEILMLFPDPWPKKRHQKRRLVQPTFVELMTSRLKRGGVLRLATDWAHYAEAMLETLQGSPGLENLAEDGRFIPRPGGRTPTRFEQRGTRLGHEVWDLAFRRR